jgi:hypothetical protein
MLRRAFLSSVTSALTVSSARALAPLQTPTNDTSGGWRKDAHNPVLGGSLGVCFDVSVLREGDKYRMWFSWRNKKSVALVESTDGIHWGPAAIVLGPNPATKWEDDINRPVVIRKGDSYLMWYTGQAQEHSCIGLATSKDGTHWERAGAKPVLSARQPWEKVAVMCPCVMWDESMRVYRMWYSGGEQYEPDAIGYATSPDGRSWTKLPGNPVFEADPEDTWECYKVAGCQVLQRGTWYYMFYIGFRDIDHAQIGAARSLDGITGWQPHTANPIIRPGINQWDHDACYKPYAIFEGHRWLLWYNGRRRNVEQIGLAIHDAEDLGF